MWRWVSCCSTACIGVLSPIPVLWFLALSALYWQYVISTRPSLVITKFQLIFPRVYSSFCCRHRKPRNSNRNFIRKKSHCCWKARDINYGVYSRPVSCVYFTSESVIDKIGLTDWVKMWLKAGYSFCSSRNTHQSLRSYIASLIV